MMQQHQSNQQGFSIIETAIVLVVVSLLAVLSTIAHQSIRQEQAISEDDSDALWMTEVVQAYIETYDPLYLTAPDIRFIVHQSLTHDFVPRQKNQAFYYDIANQEVIVAPSYERALETGMFLPNVEWTRTGEQLEEVIEGFLLLSTNSSRVAEAIHAIRNLQSSQTYRAAARVLAEYELNNHGALFELNKAIYVSDFFVLTHVDQPVTSHQVIFSEEIVSVPQEAFNTKGAWLPEKIRLPISVKVIEREAFTGLSGDTKIIHDAMENLLIEQGAFHPEDEMNQALRDREGTITIETIQVRMIEIMPETRFYQDDEKTQYLGRIVRDNQSKYFYYDEEDNRVGGHDGINYYSPNGEIVESGIYYQAIVELISLFNAARNQTTVFNQTVHLTLSDGRSLNEAGIKRLTTEYHYLPTETRVTVIAYDIHQNFMAKGLLRISSNVPVDLPDVIPPRPISSPSD